jgi:hypothetical protein
MIYTRNNFTECPSPTTNGTLRDPDTFFCTTKSKEAFNPGQVFVPQHLEHDSIRLHGPFDTIGTALLWMTYVKLEGSL